MESERRIRRNRIRRQRQLRRRMALAAAGFLTLCVLVCGVTARAQGSSSAGEKKYFTSILIMPGDTLSSIAAAHADGHYDSAADYIREICETNHIQDENAIDAGDYLIIPYYR